MGRLRLLGRRRGASLRRPCVDLMKPPTFRSLAAILAAALAPWGALPAADAPAAFTQPKAISQQAPEYPWSLRLDGKKGEVLLDFIVDKEGSVSKVAVLKSSHPDFEAPAVEALLKWKFKPGMVDGHPVYTHMRVPMLFQLNSTPYHPGHGVDIWTIPGTASKKLPAEFQYDSPPKPILTSAPVYPLELLKAKVTGKAEVSFAVDPRGKTHVTKVSGASHPEFAAAAEAMIASWRFEPATKGGAPCWALLSKEQEFDRDAADFPLNDSADRLLSPLKKNRCPIVLDSNALDEKLQGRFQPEPDVPDSIRKARQPCQAVIEFIIDHAGHAQLPRIVSASSPEFGWAAATAVARWQYTQPQKGGRPVDVFVRVPMVYNGENPPAAGS
jgi:TonB family protein